MKTALRWLCCALLGAGALCALLLVAYGNALPLRLGLLAPQLFALFELRWGWFALGVALFALLFRLTPAGKAGWTVGLTLLLGGGALAAIIGANWIPGQYGPAPPAPHLVDRLKISQIRDEDGHLDQVLHPRSRRAQDGADVFHALARLGLNVPLHQLSCRGQRDLARRVEKTVGDDALRIRADGARRVIGLDRFLAHPNLLAR